MPADRNASHRGQAPTSSLLHPMWEPVTAGEPSEEAFLASCLLGKGVVEASRKLSMYDLRLWSALCGLYAVQQPEDGRTVETTGYELIQLVNGRSGDNRGGKDYTAIGRSLYRLMLTRATIHAVEKDPDLDAITRHTGYVNLLGNTWYATTELSLTSPEEWGALKGATSMKIELGTYPIQQIQAGACTWLDLDVMRWLGTGLAARVWVALEAWADYRERDLTGGVERTAISLAPPAMNSLGLGGYARHVDARKGLIVAGKKIVAEDPAYRSITVAKHMNRWHLYAERVLGPGSRAAARREWRSSRPCHLEIRAQARRSLEAAKQA